MQPHGHMVTRSHSHGHICLGSGKETDAERVVVPLRVLNSSTLTNPVRARPVWCCHMYIPANLWMPRARIFSEWVGYWPTGRDPHLYGGGEIAILNSRRQNIVQGVGKV
eukprot:1195304-Prorocentrum_minimum.AAC.9